MTDHPGTTAPARGHGMSATARAELAAATKARKHAAETEERWRAAVRAAFDAGIPRDEIAALAGISRSRVHQIRKGTR